MAKEFLAPKRAQIRQPLDNNRQHGKIVNPPRFNEMGGAHSLKGTGIHKTNKTIHKPGGGAS